MEAKLKLLKADNKERLKEIIKLHEEMQVYTNKDFFVFEPNSFMQKMGAINQNMFEIFMLVSIAIFGLLFPSIVAAIFFIVSHNLIVFANAGPDYRVKWGHIATFVNIGLLAIVGVIKAKYIIGITKLHYLNVEEYKDGVRFWEGFGFDLERN